jgi:hypothetical protein
MDLKNKKQELSEILAQLGAAGSYDELIILSQKVMLLATELKISERLEAQIDSKVKDAVAREAAQLKELIKAQPIAEVKVVEPAVEVVKEIPKVEEAIAPVLAQVPVTPPASAPAPAAAPAPRGVSISEKLQTADVSIAARLSKSGIKDLTKAVSINQKILFTKELFKGDSFAFNEALGKLNAFESKTDAMQFLNTELSSKFAFKTEAESYLQFVELIERRYV